MLIFTQPSILDDLKDMKDKFMRLDESNRTYSDKSLFEGKISIVIGFDEHVNSNLMQIPLEGYCFKYHMYVSTLNKKAVVKEFTQFMQKYYPLKLDELRRKVI